MGAIACCLTTSSHYLLNYFSTDPKVYVTIHSFGIDFAIHQTCIFRHRRMTVSFQPTDTTMIHEVFLLLSTELTHAWNQWCLRVTNISKIWVSLVYSSVQESFSISVGEYRPYVKIHHIILHFSHCHGSGIVAVVFDHKYNSAVTTGL